MPRLIFSALLAVTTLAAGTEIVAEETGLGVAPEAQQGEDGNWFYGQSYAQRPDPRAIIHQKAQYRAQQRMARMASMRWYGMYNERPTASPTPFTALYSPVWQVPGGRPYGWYSGHSTVIVAPRSEVLRR